VISDVPSLRNDVVRDLRFQGNVTCLDWRAVQVEGRNGGFQSLCYISINIYNISILNSCSFYIKMIVDYNLIYASVFLIRCIVILNLLNL